MTKNNNLNKAKKVANDEFYTMYKDIENEIQNYKDYFKGKVVYCNCDSEESNFYKYFQNNFETLELKQLLRSSLNDGVPFQSKKGIELLKQADIVVTNPPFSLFRDFVALLVEHNKKFIIVGSSNAITYKGIFKLIKENDLWLGINHLKQFTQPDGTIKAFGNISWFTNLEHKKRNEPLLLTKTYKGNETSYPKYDNYNAIEVSRTKDIPIDYKGTMGVPISFLDKFCANQFEILGLDSHLLNNGLGNGSNSIDSKNIYRRIIIKNKISND